MPLYNFQAELLNGSRNSLRVNQAVIAQLGTGGGKTYLGSEYVRLCLAKNKRCLFIVHRDFLIEQTAEALRNAGVEFGIIAAGYTPDYRAAAQIASIDTLRHRMAKVGKFDLVIVDECHHVLAPTWLGVVRQFMEMGAKVLGLTATPWRMSGAALGTVFTDMVQGPPIRWLIDNGYLSDYRAFAPSTPDMDGVHVRAGDYVQSETEKLMDQPTLVGDAVATYQRLARGGRALAFCTSVLHSQHVAASFRDSGVRAWHLDGTTAKDERRTIIARFKRGEIDVLSSVEIFGEGFDSPAVDALILLRPTQSLGLHLQQLGRGLRTAPGKQRVIVSDHAGNCLRLGLPDDDFQWSLQGGAEKKKGAGDKAIAVMQCAKCYAVAKPFKICPECGHKREIEGRSVKQVEGELVELEIDVMRRKAAQQLEVQMAKTIADLVAIGKRRGYKSPYFWATKVIQGRRAKQRASA